MNTVSLQVHIEQLIRQIGVRVDWRGSAKLACYYPSTTPMQMLAYEMIQLFGFDPIEIPAFVLIPRITDKCTYLTSLHELGHAHYAHDGSDRYNGLAHEVMAWMWAFDHCLIPIDADVLAHARWALEGHIVYTYGGFFPKGHPMENDYNRLCAMLNLHKYRTDYIRPPEPLG